MTRARAQSDRIPPPMLTSSSSSPRRIVALAATMASLAALVTIAPPAHAQEAERSGGRFGVSLLGGLALGTDRASGPAGFAGLSLRFGGAVTDRVHILGEFTLAAMPGGIPGWDSAFHAALNLAVQGYIGPRFFIRGGVGAGWATAVNGGSWWLPLPGPRISGAVGYDLWRRGERSISLALETSYTFLYSGGGISDRLFTLGVGVGFDWY